MNPNRRCPLGLGLATKENPLPPILFPWKYRGEKRTILINRAIISNKYKDISAFFLSKESNRPEEKLAPLE